jgi:FkbM family methyltransferase
LASLKRRIVETTADLLGCFIFRKAEAPRWPERYFAVRLFDRLKPDCVFDVGANVGQYAQLLRQSGFRGLIFSFEPNPIAFEELKRNASFDPNWHCFPNAIGAEARRTSFNIMKAADLSSFLDPAADALDFKELNVVERVVEVEVSTLNDCVPQLQSEHGFTNPFLKMDTQGFDLEVLRGGSSVLNRFCGALSEIPVWKIYDKSPGFTESVEAFSRVGFDVAAFFSVNPELLLRVIEFNCYCVRRDLVRGDSWDLSTLEGLRIRAT